MKKIAIKVIKCTGCERKLDRSHYWYNKTTNKWLTRCDDCRSEVRRKRKGQKIRATAKDSDELVYTQIQEKLILNGKTGCKEWQGGLSKVGGYGGMRYRGKSQKVHRVVYCIHNKINISEIKEWKVCHSCDNPCCCNEHHLFLGTDQDNVDDKIGKNRHFQKLNENIVLDIKNAIEKAADRRVLSKIAIKYDISERLVYAIKNGARHAKTGLIGPKFSCVEASQC